MTSIEYKEIKKVIEQALKDNKLEMKNLNNKEYIISQIRAITWRKRDLGSATISKKLIETISSVNKIKYKILELEKKDFNDN